jgi:fibronectin type 3 domain-containing protein
VDHYIVYRSTTASDPGDSIAATVMTSYTDTDVVGNESVQYFYSVKAIDTVGNKSEESNRVGEFDRGLVRVK